MKKKMIYEIPEVELIRFSSADVIITSDVTDGGTGDSEIEIPFPGQF